jgi:hypothetical protein
MTVKPWGSKAAIDRKTWVGPLFVNYYLLLQIFRTGASHAIPQRGFSLPDPTGLGGLIANISSDIRWHSSLFWQAVSFAYESWPLTSSHRRHGFVTLRRSLILEQRNGMWSARQARHGTHMACCRTLVLIKRELTLRLTEALMPFRNDSDGSWMSCRYGASTTSFSNLLSLGRCYKFNRTRGFHAVRARG